MPIPLENVPDPDTSGELARRHVEGFVAGIHGRARREAAALIAELTPLTPDDINRVVAVAWMKGASYGFRSAAGQLGVILADHAPESSP